VNSLTADGKSAIELESTVITEEDMTTQNIENNYYFNYFTRMTKRDICISKIIHSSIIREFSQKFFPHGTGWDRSIPRGALIHIWLFISTYDGFS
jgi:hypothetical protein